MSTLISLITLRWRRLTGPLSPSVVDTSLLDRLFQLADLLFVFDAYEQFTNLLSPRLRSLSPSEVHLLRPIFGNSVPYHRIRIDERAHLGPRRYRFFYVSFHTINSWGPIDPPTLVHEVVHVWQYRHRGALYISRALAAQRTKLGYDYGGIRGLAAARGLDDFNYEQMADVIEDAYRLTAGYAPQWLRGRSVECLPAYFDFLHELQRPSSGNSSG